MKFNNLTLNMYKNYCLFSLIKKNNNKILTFLRLNFEAFAHVCFVAVLLKKTLQRLVGVKKNHRLFLFLLQNTLHICTLLVISTFILFAQTKHSGNFV